MINKVPIVIINTFMLQTSCEIYLLISFLQKKNIYIYMYITYRIILLI